MSKRPINVEVKINPNESVDRAIRRFMKKVKKEKIIENYRARTYYEKPSTIRRREKINRKRVVKKLEAEKKNDIK